MTQAMPPTGRQLRYLRSLAEQTQTTFSYPKTRGQASAEIQRLLALDECEGSSVDEQRESEDCDQYATAVLDEEVSGFGSSARWRSSPAARPGGGAARRIDLARYGVGEERRVLGIEKRGGRWCVIDRDECGAGALYLVERDCQAEPDSALQALVIDYLRQADELGSVPMASTAVGQLLGLEGSGA
jgi:hypothetical protein